MKPVAGRGYLACDFCSTFHFTTPLDQSPDTITPLGEASEIACPVCEGMLSKGALDDGHALFCENCRGILVDCEHFADVVRRRRADRIGPESKPLPLEPAELRRQILCPLCGSRMEVHPYYGPGNAVIDSCCRCHTVWLDYGEMAGIVTAPGLR